ncbi:MAG: dTDP-4-dehydrorhamnose reductase [Nitrospirota bacterium]
MKILLLGKLGMLGSQMLKTLSGSEDFEMYAFDKDDLDISDKEALSSVFKRISPNFVINCAAYTAVDACETEKDMALKINGDAPGAMAAACKEENAVLLHISTDYVFDGENPEGYKEDDRPSPINVYGESKLRGERLIAENWDKHYIVRTSWLYGENGKNFVETMLKLAETKSELDVVDDQIGSPTYSKDLCEELIRCFLMPYVSNLPRQHNRTMGSEGDMAGNDSPVKKPSFGVYHLTNSDHTSWCGFAKKIFKLAKLDVKVNPVTSEEFPRPAKRPHCSILQNTKLDCRMRSWKEALNAYLQLTT